MHRKRKRDQARKAPAKSNNTIRYVNDAGKVVQKTTTFVTPEMRRTLKPAKES